MKTNFRLILLGLLVAFQGHAAKFFSPADQNQLKEKSKSQVPKSFQLYKVDLSGIFNALQKAPKEKLKSAISTYGLEIVLPVAKFGELKFKVADIPVLEGNAQDKFPAIKTFTGQCVEKPSFTLKLDITPLGLHAAVFGDDDIYIIDPIELKSDVVMVYKFSDFPKNQDFHCSTSDDHKLEKPTGSENKALVTSLGTQRREYRLAIGTNSQFVSFYGGTQTLALSALVTKVNRMNGIYERDYSIRMNLVSNSLSLMGLFTVIDAPELSTIHSTIATAMGGTANFDIGHYVGVKGLSASDCGFNGLAQLGVVCNNSSKGRGFSQAGPCAVNDPWVDFGLIPHEVGHMFGANHTFNSDCTGNRNGTTAFEPGAGNSLMSYWFGCEDGGNDGSLHPFFHSGSWFEISNYTTTGSTGFSCPVFVNTGNAVPTASAGSNLYIPSSTPLLLAGTSSDEAVDLPNLTRSWDQIDVGPITPPNAPSGNAPLFRMREPNVSNERVLPALNSILTGTSTIGETLPSYSRRFRMAFLVRDNRAGNGATRVDTSSYYVVGTAGPFSIVSPNASTTGQQGASLSVTWNIAGTNLAPINTSSVGIDLSLNNGTSFQTLLASTPNDGSQTVTLPTNSLTSTARIRVRAIGNIYFALSPAFTIGLPNYSIVNSGNQTICNGGDPGNISMNTTGVPVAVTYQWYFKNGIVFDPLNTDPIGTWSTISGATSSSYNPPLGLTQNRTYACRLTSASYPGGSGWATGVRQVTVLSPVNYGTLAAGNQTFSETGDPSLIGFSTAPSGGNGTFAYRWYKADGLVAAPTGTTIPANWTLVSGATSSTYDPPLIFGNTSYAAMVDPTGSQNCGDFTWASGVRQITINNSCLSYCKPDRAGLSPNSSLYLSSVNLGGQTQTSGFNNHYGNFGLTNYFIKGTTVSFSINATGSTGITRYYAVFADWNRDGDFSDGLAEIVGLSGSSTSSTFSGSITIPTSALGGRTTIRTYVIAGYNPLSNSCPSLASDLWIGEVEDYCVFISNGLNPGTIAAGNQDLCSNSIPGSMSVSGFSPTTGTSFQWYFRDGIVSAPASSVGIDGWTPISGATSGTFTPTTPLTSSRSYACRASSGGSSLWAAGVRQITIRAVFNSGTLAAGNQTFTGGSGDPATISFSTLPSGGRGTFAYRWYSANGIQPAPGGTIVPAGWTLISGASSSSYNPPVISASTSYAAMVDPTGTPDCGVFTWASGVRQITIVPVGFTPGALSSFSETICNGGDPSNIVFSEVPTAGSSFQWYFQNGILVAPANTDPVGSWTIITGSTSNSYDPPAGLTQSRTFVCRVINGANSQWATGARQMNVLPAFNPGTLASGNQTFTGSGDPSNIAFSTAPSGGSGTFAYRWYSRPGIHAAPTGTTIPAEWTFLGITSTSFDPPVQSASISFAAMVDATGSTDCAPFTWANGVRQITINPASFSPGVLAAGNQTICNGAGPASVLFSTNPTTGSAYQWYFRDGIVAAPANTDPIGVWQILTGQTGSFLTPGATSNSRTYACRVTNGANSQWASGVRQVTVLPPFSPGTLISNLTSCPSNGFDPAPVTMVTNPQGSGQYKWDWFYLDNPTVTCPTVASPTTAPAGWTSITGDVRFSGTSTTGVGILFDATTTPASGRTWVLRITPQANGATPACGITSFTNCNRTIRGTGCRAAVDDLEANNNKMEVGQNIPNPFSDQTSISYFIPSGNGDGQLEVVSINGKVLITELVHEGVRGEVEIRKGSLSPGTYFYRLKTMGSMTRTHKMVVQ